MFFLPQDTELGTLSLVEIYVYYDRPCLFSTLSDKGQYFLVLWIDETSESDHWLYVPVSKAVLNIMQSPDFDFRNAIQNAVGDRVFDVEVFNDERSTKVNVLNCSDLSDESLSI